MKERNKICERKTSAYKTFTWRAIASIITAAIVYIVSGRRVDLAIAGGAIDVPVKLIAYYYHERAWIWWGGRK